MTKTDDALVHPPKARIAFRVGVIGHLPDRLPKDKEGLDAITARIGEVLGAVSAAVGDFAAAEEAKAVYSPLEPVLVAVSPLAEGADRMFASSALDLGYSLCSPMAFAQDEYEKDFAGTPGSLDEFSALLRRARDGAGLTTFELDGTREDPNPYGACGRLVINQSDLLVAVWDGGDPKGAGGTPETLREALHFHLPVIWIDARAPHGWKLIQSVAEIEQTGRGVPPPPLPLMPAEADEPQLKETVQRIVQHELAVPTRAPPQPEGELGGFGHAKDDEEQWPIARAKAYFRQRRPPIDIACFWSLFRCVALLRAFRHSFLVKPFSEGVWPNAPGTPAAVGWANDVFRDHYAWADRLADLKAEAHRSGFVVMSLLAALAVGLALLPSALQLGHPKAGQLDWEAVTIVLELLVLTSVLVILVLGRKRRWHESWLEYRVLAELIRQARLLAPLGGGRPLLRTPPHLTIYGDLSRSWMHWQMRAIARAAGIPGARVDIGYVTGQIDEARNLATGSDGQLEFHDHKHRESESIHHRLHLASLVLFGATFVAIAVHLGLHLVESAAAAAAHAEPAHEGGPQVGPWLVFVSAAFPAFGAALASINNQGEFARLAKRSHSMAAGFKRYIQQFDGLRDRLDRPVKDQAKVRLANVADLSADMAATMVNEVAEWRIVVTDLAQAAS